MAKRVHYLLRDGLGWGLALWLVGYVLGLVFFPLVPAALIGWYVMPLGLAVTMFVLWKWVRASPLGRALAIGVVWAALAILLDYLFIVKLLQPADGYYKFDVYLYYLSCLLLPVIAALLRMRAKP